MTNWIDRTELRALPVPARDRLTRLLPMTLPKGHSVFRAGDAAQGFALVLQGRIDVFLTGPGGRDILLYSVAPGQSCVQTTLGLLGSEPYSGDAIAATDCTLVLIRKPLFLTLMDSVPDFRSYVFSAFARRIQDVTHLLEQVAFQRIEIRLAAALLALAKGDAVDCTHADLASRIGSAREVVSRQLDGFARRGWLSTDRGHVHLHDIPALQQLAEIDSAL